MAWYILLHSEQISFGVLHSSETSTIVYLLSHPHPCHEIYQGETKGLGRREQSSRPRLFLQDSSIFKRLVLLFLHVRLCDLEFGHAQLVVTVSHRERSCLRSNSNKNGRKSVAGKVMGRLRVSGHTYPSEPA